VGPITKAASDALLADHNSVDLTGWGGFLHDLSNQAVTTASAGSL
jgi:hypothetical protein